MPIKESGGQSLELGAIGDGKFLKRSGANIIGADADGGSLPAGLIVMWHGLLAAIPTGWALCDGQNGTPDLRSKFVKGAAAAADPGTTGGASTHTHDYTQVVQHTHGVTDAGHTHTQNSHNHTQDAHTHTQNSHNHTQDAHTHTQNAHNHDIRSQTATTGAATSYEHGAVDTSSTNTAEGHITADATAVNQNATATNQAATATNQNATATNQAATATNQSATTGVTTNNPAGSVATGTTAAGSSEPAHYCVAFIMKT